MLGEPARLKLRQLVPEREMSVTKLGGQSGAGQPNGSKHLGILLEAGLVVRRKEGLSVLYSIADESVTEVMRDRRQSLGVKFAAQHKYFKHLKRRT